MTDDFDVFQNDTAEVFEAVGISGYGSSAEMRLLYVISADIQPISASVADREFSIASERRMRMFFSEKYDLRAGQFVKTGGVMYRVEYAQKRGLGAEAVIKEVI